MLQVIASESFADWLRSLMGPEGESARSERDRVALEDWFGDVYDAEGPVSREAADARFAIRLDELARASAAKVLADVERTTVLRPLITIEVDGGTVRIEYRSSGGSGGYQTPSMSAIDPVEALAEVADYLQEFVTEDLGAVWPTCTEHDAGLHPEVRDDDAVWWCLVGQHLVGAVGSLSRSH